VEKVRFAIAVKVAILVSSMQFLTISVIKFDESRWQIFLNYCISGAKFSQVENQTIKLVDSELLPS
jgi:hypothetical protein